MNSATQDNSSCIYGIDLCGTGTFWDIPSQTCLAEDGTETPCLGDFNGDEIINAGDLLLFLGVFGMSCP